MAESDWLRLDDGYKMLRQARFRSSRRKSRLFAVACCRRIWGHFIDDRSRGAVEVAERYADGEVSDAELARAAQAAHQAHQEVFALVGKVGSVESGRTGHGLPQV